MVTEQFTHPNWPGRCRVADLDRPLREAVILWHRSAQRERPTLLGDRLDRAGQVVFGLRQRVRSGAVLSGLAWPPPSERYLRHPVASSAQSTILGGTRVLRNWMPTWPQLQATDRLGTG
jgi:hypothetical protein